jgi:hypothetical protein
MAIATGLDTERKRRAATRSLIKNVVVAQGNIFIRELLRGKKLSIGTTKEDFEANLLQAINNGELQFEDVIQWLEEVEGWGDQHVYLYHLPTSVTADQVWRSADTVRAKLSLAQKKLWEAHSLSFPETWELTGISYADRVLTYVWHEKYPTLLRRPKLDRREEIDGDTYEFRAFLERPDRSVLRFVLQLEKARAAVFLQIPAEGNAHKNALDMVQNETKPLVDWGALLPFSASDAIKNLGQAALNSKKVAADIRSRKTRLTAAQAYIEFGSTAEDGDFLQSTAVRDVRSTVQLASFVGNTAIFGYSAQTPTGLARAVTIEIFGEQRRIKLRAQLKANEVWNILDLLGGFENGQPGS